MPEQGYFALALDGRKRQVDSIASNAGQCLWSGIIESEKASQWWSG
jgi:glycogen debranching enzyme